MANKSTSMVLFVLTLLVLGPVLLISGVFAISWAWESISGCFFSLSYVCGQVDFFKAGFFGLISFGSFLGIKTMWDKAK
jgi:hypothetical protein